MMITGKVYLIVVIFSCVQIFTLGQLQQQVVVQRHEAIAFPERPEEDERRQNAMNRKPYYIPGKCKDNELLFPGDQVDDWICDCSPGHIFFPPNDKCYPIYRQGPCDPGYYLILKKKQIIPECALNPCNKDGQVMYNDACHNLGKPGPCPRPELSYVLGVNTTTLDLACVKLSMVLEDRFSDDDDNKVSLNYIDMNSIPLCAKGCKRYIRGTCPTRIN